MRDSENALASTAGICCGAFAEVFHETKSLGLPAHQLCDASVAFVSIIAGALDKVTRHEIVCNVDEARLLEEGAVTSVQRSAVLDERPDNVVQDCRSEKELEDDVD